MPDSETAAISMFITSFMHSGWSAKAVGMFLYGVKRGYRTDENGGLLQRFICDSTEQTKPPSPPALPPQAQRGELR